MNSIVKKVVLAVGSLGLVSLASMADVSARGVAASSGSSATSMACWTINANGAVVNGCSPEQRWVVGLPVDAGGTKGMTFSGANVKCKLCAGGQTGLASCSQEVAIGSTEGTASTTTVVMPGAGRLYADCKVSTNGLLYNVNYTQ